MSVNLFGVAFAGLTMLVSLGGATVAPPAATQQYNEHYPGVYCGSIGCWPIVYQHDVYSDAELTNWIGGGYDTCTQSMGMVFRNEPNLPAGYDVKTPLYLCAPGGPYEIPADGPA
jgi:hypothetical protein